MKKLLLCDNYKVLKNQQFFDVDLSLLTLLYQPIMGHEALAVYCFFLSDSKLNDSEKLTISQHSRITSTTKMSLELFLEARKKLEALGLLKTLCEYNLNSNLYIYLLYPPMSPSLLAQNNLTGFLQNQLTTKDFEKSMKLFQANVNFNDKNFVNISTNFSEYFQVTADSKLSLNHANLKLIGRKKQIIFKINLDAISKTLQMQNVPISLRQTIHMLRYLQSISLIFNFSNEEIAHHLIDLANELGVTKLSSQPIKDYFEKLKISESKSLPDDLQDVNRLQSKWKKSTKLIELGNLLEASSVASFYNILFKKPLSNDIAHHVNKAMCTYKLEPGVINAIFYFIKDKKKIYTDQYFDTICHDLSNLGKDNDLYCKSALYVLVHMNEFVSFKTKLTAGPKLSNQFKKSSVQQKNKNKNKDEEVFTQSIECGI